MKRFAPIVAIAVSLVIGLVAGDRWSTATRRGRAETLLIDQQIYLTGPINAAENLHAGNVEEALRVLEQFIEAQRQIVSRGPHFVVQGIDFTASAIESVAEYQRRHPWVGLAPRDQDSAVGGEAEQTE